MVSTYILTMLGLISFCIVLLVILMKLNKRNRQQIEKMMGEWQKQNKYMEETVKICNKALELTSEVKNNIDSAQIESQKNYIKKCEELLCSINGADTAIGVLLSEKKRMCREKNINFIDEAVFIPTEECIKEVDSVSVMGNLLDNAIEAALRVDDETVEKYVKLVSQKKKNIWTIKVVNTKVRETSLDAHMETEKKDKENHGFGIGIVNMIADKYNGRVRMIDRKDSFEVSVHMIMKKVKAE